MRIEYLEEFVLLAQNLSFTETASLLNISQPTLSKHINALERELKAPLFKRGGPSIALTMAGQLILPHAYSILEERKGMAAAAKKGMSSLAPRLSIGGNVGLKTVLERISMLASRFSELYGVEIIELQDIEMNPCTTIDMAMSSAPDILFTYLDETDEIGEDTEIRFVARVPLSVVVSKAHKFAGKDSVTLDDLATETFVKLEGNYVSNSWRFIESACLQAGFFPHCHHVYFPRIADFLKVTFQLQHDVLVLTNDYIQQYSAFISDKCVAVPIDDDRAFMPLSVMYSMSNANPLIDEALEIILGTNGEDA